MGGSRSLFRRRRLERCDVAAVNSSRPDFSDEALVSRHACIRERGRNRHRDVAAIDSKTRLLATPCDGDA